jgi:RNA polymerase sigma-70 factor (ECF subfamily)
MNATLEGRGLSDLNSLLAQARAGSATALGQLLEACQPYLLLLAEKQLPGDLQPKVSPSDLIQETFAEAHEGFRGFEGRTEAELFAWLQTILRHNALKWANRYRNTDKRQLDRERSLNDSRFAHVFEGQLVADQTSPSVKAIRAEEAQSLERALERLPEDYRRVILLHHRDNRPFGEIATILGRTEAATRKLWARAIERWGEEVQALEQLAR